MTSHFHAFSHFPQVYYQCIFVHIKWHIFGRRLGDLSFPLHFLIFQMGFLSMHFSTRRMAPPRRAISCVFRAFKESAIFRCIPSDSASNFLCLFLLRCFHPEFFIPRKRGETNVKPFGRQTMAEFRVGGDHASQAGIFSSWSRSSVILRPMLPI